MLQTSMGKWYKTFPYQTQFHSDTLRLISPVCLHLSVSVCLSFSVPYIIKTPETQRGHVLGGGRKRHKESKYLAQGPQ